MDVGLYVGTVGQSVWFSEDRGESWVRPYSESGLYMESRAFSLTSQPSGGSSILAGTDEGLFRLQRAARKWEHIRSPLDDLPTWSLVQSPHDPNVLLAGTRPAALFRSADGGGTWDRLPVQLATSCIYVVRTRVTQILFDPRDAGLVWAGIEIDGIYRSRDAGKSWEKCVSEGLPSEDIHGIAVVFEDGRRKLFATTNKGLCVSLDDGDTWALRPLDSEWQYTRAIVAKADDRGVMFLTNGDGPPGSTGRVLRSTDYGETWSRLAMPAEVNSTPWCVAVHPGWPDLVLACTNLGQLFVSDDGGDSWSKVRREFGEVRALMLRPL